MRPPAASQRSKLASAATRWGGGQRKQAELGDASLAREAERSLPAADVRHHAPIEQLLATVYDRIGASEDGGSARTFSVGALSRSDGGLGVGQRVGRWEVSGVLGRGGLGTVYAVRHADLGHAAALKVLHARHAEHAARLLREGRLAARIQHDNVVAVLDLLTVEGQPALLLERIDGPDLATHIARAPPDRDRIDALVAGIGAGLGAAHAIGIVHRDLKLANVLLAPGPSGQTPKITDFGLARLVVDAEGEALTQSGVRMGTPGYMAPEQLRSARAASPRSDLFALGCTAYALVARRPAFDASGRAVPLAAAAPDAPARWVAAVAAAMQSDPCDRPASTRAFLFLWTGR